MEFDNKYYYSCTNVKLFKFSIHRPVLRFREIWTDGGFELRDGFD